MVLAASVCLAPLQALAANPGAAQAQRVTITRDTWGIAHIRGKTDADAVFGMIYAQAEDDFNRVETNYLTALGRRAQAEGEAAIWGDLRQRLFINDADLKAQYAKSPGWLKTLMTAWADGLNYYLATHPQVKPKVLTHFEPWMALSFTEGSIGGDIEKVSLTGLESFYGKRQVAMTEDELGLKPWEPSGSNGIAIAPSRSADGATRLLVNSHQPYSGPVAWYEAVLESGQGWHVAGGFFPGSPFMLHGHNAHLGWANTVNKPDLIDVYRLTVNPANENQYKLDGQWKAFEVSDAALKVKVFGPLTWTVHRPVLRSAFGPVLKTPNGVFAIRYAGMGEIRQVEQYYRLDKARDLAEWRAAMALQALPSINYVYADEKGNIGYVYNAQFPNRTAKADWSGILPGDRSDLIWNGYLPFDKVPQIWNPKSGYVFNSNNTPFDATAPADDLKPADFPASMGIQTNTTNRAMRAQETFGADASITADEFAAYKFDIAYSRRSEVAALMGELIALDAKGDADILAAQKILKGWDLKTDVKNRGAALALLVAQPVLTAREKHQTPDLRAALTTAIGTLKKHFKRLDPEWGEVNRIRHGDVDLGIDGGPDTYRAVYGEPQKNGKLTAKAGDTFIMFVTWDKAGKLSSQSIHQFGAATSDPQSPHYADQTPMFVAMKMKPVLFTADQLKGHIEEDYTPKDRAPKQ